MCRRPRCPHDQHALSRFDVPDVAKCLKGGESGDGHDRSLVEGKVRRLLCQLLLLGAGVLGEGTLADAEDFVADAEPGHTCADRYDRAGDVESGHGVLGSPQASAHEPKQVRPAGHEVPCAPVEAGGVNPNQHLFVSERGPVDLPESQHVGGLAVAVLDHCPHRLPLDRQMTRVDRIGHARQTGGGR